jgi:hypothetical protein
MKRLVVGMAAVLAVLANAQQPQQWPPESLKITVEFSDGTTVPLTLRRQNVDWWPSDPTQDGPANVKRLEPMANAGDTRAAFGISQFLNDCKSAPRDEAQLAAWIKALREKHLLTWGDGHTSELPAGAVDQYEKSYRDKFRRCKGLTASDLASANTWQRKAADGGHLWALIYVYQDNNSGLTPAERLKVARKTWEIGDIGGLDRVSRGLEDVNRIESVGYALLAERLTAAQAEAANNPGTKFSMDAAARSLQNKMNDLTPDERKRALAIAKDVLARNRNCCFVH